MATIAKKRNPQDATRRNVQAAAKRDAALDARLDKVENGLKLAFVHIAELAKAGLAEDLAAAITAQIIEWSTEVE